MFCQYKNIFGEPNKGIHAIRVADFAVVDILLTILASIFIKWIFKVSLIYSLIALFLLSIVMHRLFCVRTKVDRLIFG